MEESLGEAAGDRRHRFKVVGVGDAGCRAVTLLSQKSLPGVDYLACNSDAASLGELSDIRKVQLGKEMLRGLSTGGDSELGRAIAEASQEPLKREFAEASLVIFLGGLGGGTASGALPIMARQARETGSLVLCFVSMPLELEGEQRRSRAEMGHNHLVVASDAVILLPNQSYYRSTGGGASMGDMFEEINRLIAQGVQGIWRMIGQAGLINVSFRDLHSVVAGKHAKSSFAVASATGERRWRQAAESLVNHPMLQGERPLEDADALLLNIHGGRDFSTVEADRIVRMVREKIGKAEMIVGAAQDTALDQAVELTLIVSWHRKVQPVELKIEAPEGECSFPVRIEGTAIQTDFLERETKTSKSTSRFTAPPPQADEIHNRLLKEMPGTRAQRRLKRKMEQGVLNLEVASGGRFEQSSRTVRNGEDLDIPTFVRRGMLLN